MDSPVSQHGGKSGNVSFYGGNNVDTVSYAVPYSQVSSIVQSKDGSWAINYNIISTSGSKDGSKSGSTAATDSLHGIERVSFSDGIYVALDIASPNQVAGAALALLYAGFNSLPDAKTFGHWIAKADDINDSPTFDNLKIESLAQTMLKEYVPEGISDSSLVNILYTNVVGHVPDDSTLNYFTQLIADNTYTQAGLSALAAESSLNTDQYANLIGNGLQYVPEHGKVG
ncbi:MAG: hypothetical protein IPP22_00250 [Nitrosomonas sp.]|nr:hypothetical protein [Nitrosomonas sp.]